MSSLSDFITEHPIAATLIGFGVWSVLMTLAERR